MLHISEDNSEKAQRAAKRELDLILQWRGNTGGQDYNTRRDQVAQAKQAKRLAKLRRKARKAS